MTAEVRSVTVAVVTWNSASVVDGFFASLPDGLLGIDEHHVVVADNGSEDGTIALAGRLAPHATIVSTGRNAGYAAGVNRAIAAAPDADAMLVVNPDVRLGKGSVAALAETLHDDRVGIAVPCSRLGDGSLDFSLRRTPTVRRALGEAVVGKRAGRWPSLSETVRDRARYGVPGDVDWAVGAALLIRRDCWEAVGPFDESFFLYAEETDFQLRAHDAGYRVRYEPAAVVTHLGGCSDVSPRLCSMVAVNRVRLYARRHGRRRAAAFWAALLFGATTRAILGHAAHAEAMRCLVSPERRPHELRASGRLIPDV